MTTEFEEYIRNWILEDLCKPVALLNNLPKCPYAKKALLDSKVKFYTASGAFNTNTLNTNSLNALNMLFLFNALNSQNRRRNNEI